MAPKSLQSKLLGLTVCKLTVPQLSEPLRYTSDVVITDCPFMSIVLVWFLQITNGGVSSFNVTIASQVSVLLKISVTFNVTKFTPIFKQESVLGITVIDCKPQLAELPASIREGEITICPLFPISTVALLHNA